MKQINEISAGDVRWSAVSWWTWRHTPGEEQIKFSLWFIELIAPDSHHGRKTYKFRERGQNFGPCRRINILFIGQSDGIWWMKADAC